MATPSPGDRAGLSAIADMIESTPEVLRALLAPVDDSELRQRPAEDEWSVLEVIGHLILGDGPAFRDRIAGIVEGRPTIPGFDPSLEAGGRDFRSSDLAALLDELGEIRAASAAFLRSLDADELERTATYGTRGAFAAGDFVAEWPFHDHDHIQQILETLKGHRLEAMSETMRRALVPPQAAE